MQRRLITTLLAGVTALGAAAGSGGRAEAAFTFTFQQEGADVVATGSGSVDLADVSRTGEDVLPASGVSAQNAVAGVAGSGGLLGVPLAYVSGAALSSSMEFAGQTFASIGVTPGTYTWTWGSGISVDSLTVQIGRAIRF